MKNTMTKLFAVLTLMAFTVLACQQEQKAPETEKTATSDPHSFSRPSEARGTHLDLELYVHFDRKELEGVARWTVEAAADATEIVFDTRQMHIDRVTVGEAENPVDFTLGEEDPLLGQVLRVPLPEYRKPSDKINIYYRTLPEAAALGWMEPEMTAGKKLPFLFTQGQAILTRTWIPCQDSPGLRITYTAQVTVPGGMMAVMSAENPQEKSGDGVYSFRMEQPIPPYLIALAVGDIAFKSVGPRTGVYAEPVLLDKAAWEFADMENMLTTAEGLYGPYDWGRYDLIVLPPGFPFGGMENPRLTFATPTILAGDRSLVSLVAHELAHSWSGNLVTNATWNDFWLNEGFTVYFERRIMEALYGLDYTNMLELLEYRELLDEIEYLGPESPDTRLKLDLAGRDPDEGMTDIAYQKGAAFLKMLEQTAGRERFDAFLKAWFDKHKFTSVTTEDFLAFLRENLLDKYQLEANVDEWVYQPGLPGNCPVPESDRFSKVEAQARAAMEKLPDTSGWTSHEWVHFVRNLPKEISPQRLQELDRAFQLSNTGNSELLAAWLETAIRRGYLAEVQPQLESFLTSMGRRRFLMPLYTALVDTGELDLARSIFAKAKDSYHAVSANSVEKLLDEAGQQ
ncbi:MAG: aminopeptidase [Saprospirales bacterium]|nr:aminopeptidase [Saprospirales bacterium]